MATLQEDNKEQLTLMEDYKVFSLCPRLKLTVNQVIT